MKKLTIQLKDFEGNISEEKQVTVLDGEMLIMKYSKDMRIDRAHECFNGLKTAIEKNINVIGLPEEIKLEVLSIKEGELN